MITGFYHGDRLIVKSLYCILDTNITLYVNYTSIKNKNSFLSLGVFGCDL